MSKHYDRNFWQIIKYYYNDDGTRKEYPPRKGVMQGSVKQKSFDEYDQTDWARHKVYKTNKKLLNSLAKRKYGVSIDESILTIKKVVGGLMVDETKAKTIKKSINLNVLQGKSLDDKISIIENLFFS
jgi:hypothetical protein